MEAVVQDRYARRTATLRAFFQSAYEAAAAAGWDMAALKSSWVPTPDELSRLAQAHEEAQ